MKGDNGTEFPTINNCKYFLTIVDNLSRATWTCILPSKQVLTHIKTVHSYVQNHFQTSLEIIKGDNGMKFLNNTLAYFFHTYDTTHQTSCPYTPLQ